MDLKDNSIFDFMTPERAVQLYQKINSSGIPDLEWKFYGRKKLDEPQEDDIKNDNPDDNNKSEQQQRDSVITQAIVTQTEFDFDIDSFADSDLDSSTIINDSLQLSSRAEPGSERKTNLSDIMSDLIKEKALRMLEESKNPSKVGRNVIKLFKPKPMGPPAEQLSTGYLLLQVGDFKIYVATIDLSFY